MKSIFILLFTLLLSLSLKAQVFQVDTIRYKGDITKYINLVVMGDGYTATQQNTFRADADSLTAYLFRQTPWANYQDYFNVFAIRVVSAQSGIKHPKTASDCSSYNVPVSNPTTYLGSTFDVNGIHRLVAPQNFTNISTVLSANFPAYDQILIIANSPYYGGSGGAYATSTTDASSKEITAHELGHSFAGLADEYYAGDSYAAEKPNMTKQSNTALVKWKNWIGTNGVTVQVHCCGGSSALWYKPHPNCKMQFLNAPYCSVCAQTIVESVHALVNPVVIYLPASSSVTSPQRYISFYLSKLMKPLPNTLKIVWKLDGTAISTNTDSVKIDQNILSKGVHSLSASVTDTSFLLRVDNHATIHVSTITWSITKNATDVTLLPTENEVSYSIFPNPAGRVLNVSLESARTGEVSIELLSLDGKLLRQTRGKQSAHTQYLSSIDVESLPPGTYIITIKAGDFVHAGQWVKQ